MPFDLLPQQMKILVDKYELTGKLMTNNLNLDTTREDSTTFGNEGWGSEDVVLKTLTYNIEGFYEGAVTSGNPVEKSLTDILSESSIVSVLNGNDVSDPVDMFKAVGASHATTPDPTSWTKFQVAFAPDDAGFSTGCNVIPLQNVTGTSLNSARADLGKEHTSGGTFHFHLTECPANANISAIIRTKTSMGGTFNNSANLYSTGNPLEPTGGFDVPTVLRFSTTETVHRYVRVSVSSSQTPFRLFLGFSPAA